MCACDHTTHNHNASAACLSLGLWDRSQPLRCSLIFYSGTTRFALRAGPVPFKSADGGRLNDEAFLRLLTHGSAPLQPKGKSQRPGGAALADLPLVANDVVKVSCKRCRAWGSAGRPQAAV